MPLRCRPELVGTMIRRDVYERESVSDWVLISQIEHARISAQLAHSWGNAQLAPMICPRGALLAYVRREVLATIRHHDDGWRDWSGHPDLDSGGRGPTDRLRDPPWPILIAQ